MRHKAGNVWICGYGSYLGYTYCKACAKDCGWHKKDYIQPLPIWSDSELAQDRCERCDVVLREKNPPS